MFLNCIQNVAKASLLEDCSVLLHMTPSKTIEITTKEERGTTLQLNVKEINAFQGLVEVTVCKKEKDKSTVIHQGETSTSIFTNSALLTDLLKGYYKNEYQKELKEVHVSYSLQAIETLINLFYYYCYKESKNLSAYLLVDTNSVRLLVKHDRTLTKSGVYTYTFSYHEEASTDQTPCKQTYVKGILHNKDGSQTNKSYIVRTQEEVYDILRHLLESTRKEERGYIK